MDLEAALNAAVAPLAQALKDVVFFSVSLGGVQLPLIVLWLVAVGLFFTFYLGFINFRGIAEGLRILIGRRSRADSRGEITAYGALSTAISGTVGIGNIGGVAIAISLGGPGVMFWMTLAGLLGMATKFAECTLGVAYRQEHADGSVSGGPMHYLRRGFAERGAPRLGRALGFFYAATIVVGCLGIGNMFQSNQAYQQFLVVSGGEASPFADQALVFGALLALAVAVVIIGGIRSIAWAAVRLVPVMSLLYCIGALVVIGLNLERLPEVVGTIFSQAFSTEAAAGGALGALIIGFQRATFSNEAGLGSASIAHSAVRTHHPVTEGYVGLLEPLIDTVVICNCTALVILLTVYSPALAAQGLQGIEMTSMAFASVAGWMPNLVAVAALLFAFSTMIGWSYYGLKGWTYLFGNSPVIANIFKVIFCVFGALGCALQLDAVLDFSDALIFMVAVPNVIGLYLLAPRVRELTSDYWRKLGREDPGVDPPGGRAPPPPGSR